MIRASVRWFYLIAFWAVLVGGLAFAAAVLALRYWLLPGIDQHREAIAASVGSAIGRPVAIGAIAADWHGLRPRLTLTDVRVLDAAGRPALSLARVENTLSWWSLLAGQVRLHSLLIDAPELVLRRDAQGIVYVAGMAVNDAAGEGDLGDWVLRQRQIEIRDARVEWHDERREAPPLALARVNLRIDSLFDRHRFGLTAVPPAQLAAPIDLRGDLRGDTLANLAGWRGTLYLQMADADLAAWQPWLPPLGKLSIDGRHGFQLRRGSGGMRAWLEVGEGRLRELLADLRLADVAVRLGADLPEIRLDRFSARLGWQRQNGSEAFFCEKLAWHQHGQAAQPANDFRLLLHPGADGRPAGGEFDFSGLDLAALARLAEHLPLPASWRERLLAAAPEGVLREINGRWQGSPERFDRYALRAQFDHLAMRPHAGLPGFHGFAGNLQADQDGGVATLSASHARLEFPGVMREPLALDTLNTQMNWKVRDGQVDLKIARLALSNAHLAGNLYGGWRGVAGTPGELDLTGLFDRADARQVGRYIPLTIGQATRDWLDRAFLGGHSDDVRLRLKGNLAEFPFAGGKGGVFQVKARVQGGSLDYASGWPRIDGVAGELLFHNEKMEFVSSAATIYGVKLGKVRATIPDLMVWDEMLEIDGSAAGPLADFFRFLDTSPVGAMIDDLTRGMQAAGPGRLELKLAIPLRRNQDSRVAGAFQFQNDRIVLGGAVPPLEQVNGRLEFSETGVRAQGIGAQIAGGPASVGALTQKDGTVRIQAQGRFNLAQYRPELPWLGQLKGGADWRGQLVLHKKQADLLIESNLAGLASDLPAPLAKKAGESLPLRIERKQVSAQEDRIVASLGKLVAASIGRRADAAGELRVERGTIALGGVAPAPAGDGLWLTGTLAELDLDRWRRLAGGGGGGLPGELAGMDLKLGSVEVFGRRFHDLALNGRSQANAWTVNLAGRELKGELRWNPAGRGKIIARFKQLQVPPAMAQLTAAPAVVETTPADDLPALDIFVDSLEIRQKKLGLFELLAAHQAGDWRIERLRISNADFNLRADGNWIGWLRQPQTRLNLKLDSDDVGGMLARLGQPGAVRGGKATLEGQLAWSGSPQELDYPTLSGKLALDVRNGQFLKVDPGLGKLIGILSLQALPRRITLDFRDVFSEGFAFDRIGANVRIQRGVAASDDFQMEGPSARVEIAGDTDLANETQNLKVKVVPTLGESVSGAAALLGGPVAGIASLIVQKVLQDPIGKLAAFHYSVGGTWSDPKVTKIPGAAPAEPAQP